MLVFGASFDRSPHGFSEGQKAQRREGEKGRKQRGEKGRNRGEAGGVKGGDCLGHTRLKRFVREVSAPSCPPHVVECVGDAVGG